jgi:DNA-binding IscR family transcriptional regulator
MRAAHCRTLPMWRELDKIVNNYLDNVTVADLMNKDEVGNDYVI